MLVVTSILFSTPAQAANPAKANYSRLDLTGVEIIDNEGVNTFDFEVKRMNNPSPLLVRGLEEGSSSRVVSPIFELAQTSHQYQNIYLFVGKTAKGIYKFVRVLVGQSGFMFTIDIEITDVTKNTITYFRGPPHERYKHTVSTRKHPIFR